MLNVLELEKAISFNKALRKRLQGLKKDLKAEKVSTGYHGTGSKSHRYQIFVRFPGDHVIDLWLESNLVYLGGVFRHGFGTVGYGPRTVEEVYQAVASALVPLAHKQETDRALADMAKD